jgi:hypothetical protein
MKPLIGLGLALLAANPEHFQEDTIVTQPTNAPTVQMSALPNVCPYLCAGDICKLPAGACSMQNNGKCNDPHSIPCDWQLVY